MLAGVADCRRSRKWAAKEDGNWDLNLGPAAIEERPRGSIVVGRTKRFWGRKEETTRLQSKWGGDHAALKEGVNHETLKQVDR